MPITVPPTSTYLYGIYVHCTDIRKLRSIYGRVARALEQTRRCTSAPSASGKRLRATSPAWCQCSNCSTYVGVRGDGM